MLLSAGGRRAATCRPLKPPQDFPIIPTAPVHQGCDAIQRMISSASSCSCFRFKKALVKKSVVILGEDQVHSEVKYLHGNFGRGTFTFLGGHDPEDYQHAVGDPATDLSLHVNSPGYRLILNNVLFPAAKKKKMKT